jgi:hypothetical protein
MRKIRIDFSDFWPGFCKTDNFFWNTLKTRFDVELHTQPDFLIYSNRLNHVHRVHNCTKIFFPIESYLPDWRECDYAMTSYYLEDPRHLRLPSYVLYDDVRTVMKQGEDAEAILRRKTKFCSFVVSNDNRHTRIRTQFFKRLSRYKQVDSGGRCLNNIGGPIPGGPLGKREFLKPYKFNLAFENLSITGYTTEKIFEAMWARALPVYWGSSRINEEFNPRSFLNYFDFANEEALIERIIELDRDDNKYLEVLRQPYLHGDRPSEWFDPERFLSFFDRIFSTKITPVSQRRRWFQLGRWIPVKKNRPLV